jgi:hypothetical protein
MPLFTQATLEVRTLQLHQELPFVFHLSYLQELSDLTDASFVLSNTSLGYCLQMAVTQRELLKVTLTTPKRLSSTSELTALVR